MVHDADREKCSSISKNLEYDPILSKQHPLFMQNDRKEPEVDMDKN